MKVAFDQQVFLLQRHGGISRYVCSLAEHIAAMPGVSAGIVAPVHVNDPLRQSTLGGLRLWLPPLHTKLFRTTHAIGTSLARAELRRQRPDVIHETYFTADDFSVAGCPRVLTVYDMIHEKFAKSFEGAHKTSLAKRAAVDRADHVICISQNTRRDLIDLWNVPERKVSVTYLASDKVFGEAVGASADARRPYLLIVGSRGGYKNFEGFLKAFSSLRDFRDEIDIVCFGGGALTRIELTLAGKLGLRDEQLIHVAGDDLRLAGLYKSALAFVYPSIYEGFGIPPLEAMAAGCPVISSRSSSLPEVVGDACESFDPENEDDMARAIANVVGSAERRADLVRLGTARQAQFSWEKCASETLLIYERLL